MDHLVVMGVAGSGKSTVGGLVAERLGRAFADGDDFHSPANITKMASGSSLSDEDRLPWLYEIRDWMSREHAAGRQTVVACSALRRSYRDVLRSAIGGVWFIALMAPAEVIEQRMHDREHFMPVALLESQFDQFEPLGDDEPGQAIDARTSRLDVVEAAVRAATDTPDQPASRQGP